MGGELIGEKADLKADDVSDGVRYGCANMFGVGLASGIDGVGWFPWLLRTCSIACTVSPPQL